MRNFGQFGLFTHFWCTFYRFKYYVLVPKLINISYDNFIIHKRVTLINDVNKVAKAEFALRFYIESIENLNHFNLRQIILPPPPLPPTPLQIFSDLPNRLFFLLYHCIVLKSVFLAQNETAASRSV